MTILNTMRAVRINEKCVDPAISVKDSSIQEYAQTRDEKHLVFHEGATPDRFVIRKLTASEIATANDMYVGRPTQKAMAAFLIAVHQIEMGDGSVFEIGKDELEDKFIAGRKITLPKDSWVERVIEEFGLDTVVEIGQVAIDFAGLGKRATPFFNCWVGMAQAR